YYAASIFFHNKYYVRQYCRSNTFSFEVWIIFCLPYRSLEYIITRNRIFTLNGQDACDSFFYDRCCNCGGCFHFAELCETEQRHLFSTTLEQHRSRTGTKQCEQQY